MKLRAAKSINHIVILRDYYETYIEKRMANYEHDEAEKDGDEEVANDSGFRESTPIVEEPTRYLKL